MMRSYLLLLLTNPTMSIDEWVDELRRIPFHAIISGFEPGDTPDVGKKEIYNYWRKCYYKT